MTVSHGAEPARSRRWPAALAWVLAGLAVLSGVPSIRLQSLVWFEGSPEAAPTLATVGPVILAVVSAVTVGALVASRRPAIRSAGCSSASASRWPSTCWSNRM
jgi:hypothetical protein